MNSCLDCLALEYSSIKFCRIDAVATGAAERFSSEVSKLDQFDSPDVAITGAYSSQHPPPFPSSVYYRFQKPKNVSKNLHSEKITKATYIFYLFCVSK